LAVDVGGKLIAVKKVGLTRPEMQARRLDMKWGGVCFFCKKKWKMGGLVKVEYGGVS